MSRERSPAPLYTDAFALCEWLLGRLGDDPRVLPRILCETALALLEAVLLALKGRDRDERLLAADERVLALRTHLRLAAAAGYLTESQTLFALERADAVGRQIGGWLRALEPV